MVAIGAPRPAGLMIRVAGRFAVVRDGRVLPDHEVGSRKARQLLALLAVHRGEAVRLGGIVAVLWADATPRRPADNVATLVSRLRGTLGGAAVTGDRDGYRLGPDVAVDLGVAADHIAQARRRLAGEPALAWTTVTAAVELLPADECSDDAEWLAPARDEAARLLAAARLVGAEAALRLGDAAAALEFATAAITTDVYHEPAYCLAMRAHVGLGAPARALAVYELLRSRLADDFGVDPSAASRDLHVAILRDESAPPTVCVGRPVEEVRRRMAGRDGELDRLHALWSAAAAGVAGLVLVTGEAGIGKTALSRELVALAVSTGATVLSARCYEAERSLFLQPLADALGQHAAQQPTVVLRRLAGEWVGPLSTLVPEIAAILGRVDDAAQTEVARRRAYLAVTGYVSRLADAPVLLVLDDLHNAGLATVELVHFLVRHAPSARLLVIATVRAGEATAALDMLEAVSTIIELGPLDADAVRGLAAEAGHADQTDTIIARTGGHPLFVVETLRALRAGVAGIPDSLHAAVTARVRRAGPPVEHLLRAAAVLGATIDVETLARLLDLPVVRASSVCEQALAARLLVVADRAYEFANDLIREVLYESMPGPTRLAFHRRAADLLADRPEVVAIHATAAGDQHRAARAWLLAGEEAEQRLATADAEEMLSRAMDAAGGDPEVTGRARLARGRVRDVLGRYAEANDDFRAVVAVAHDSGDRRLEMLAHQALGNDVRVAPGLTADECEVEVEIGHALRLAVSLGDRTTEAQVRARWGIVACNRLDFVAGHEHAQRAVAAARTGHDEVALAAALDGWKTTLAYVGDHEAVRDIGDELEPLLRRQRDLFRLQWLVQERAYGAVAAGDWDDALRQLTHALDLNRRSGYRAHESWFAGRVAWVHRLSGDLDEALRWGRRCVELSTLSRHAWFRSAAHAELGLVLVATGDRGQARAALSEGLTLAPVVGAEAYRLRCLAPLALCDPSVLPLADDLLASVVTPPGRAWLPGADAYLSVARAWLEAGDDSRAEKILQPLREAASGAGWHWVAAAAG